MVATVGYGNKRVGRGHTGIVMAMQAEIFYSRLPPHTVYDIFYFPGQRTTVGIAKNDCRAGSRGSFDCLNGVSAIPLITGKKMLRVKKNLPVFFTQKSDTVGNKPQIILQADAQNIFYLKVPALAENRRIFRSGANQGDEIFIPMRRISRMRGRTKRNQFTSS